MVLQRAGAVFLTVALFTAGCAAPTAGRRPGSDGDGGVPGGPYDLTAPPPLDLKFDNDAFWENDPPPMYCALDGGAFPPPKYPGGTPQCPDDKNREGCPCPTPGEKAACWPGKRANRSLGICRDGETVCERTSEIDFAWGPCIDYVPPIPGATDGYRACKCFSRGRWALDNLSPCFFNSGGGFGSGGVTSSYFMAGKVVCPGSVAPVPEDWSTSTITADCMGHFKLCYSLKAGDAKMPDPNDCEIIKVCSEGDYVDVDKPQRFPSLKGWFIDTAGAKACALKFTNTGGYGEMSVSGITLGCDKLDKVFNRVNYCPLSCNDTPNAPECAGCGQGGSGMF